MDIETQAGAFAAPGGERRFDRKGASAYLKLEGYEVADATLAKLASVGGGPLYRKFGRRPLYSRADLLEWAESRCSAPMRSTSESERRTKSGAR
jgi:hypothetical protein